ncbi:NPC intracellular cholesterol transporter 2-like [Phlebotomus papatasi]|uniref:NPC intracellular cholesterol transporter 2-like n=1 Tax=Phlebotomus papatasi TaxID=29031 RepID=UPI002483D151|nr:NPC intracellular cholesterol transporter 2-like [Phlebotomus papatasi]
MFKYLILVATFIPAIFATEGLMQCSGGHEAPLEVIVEGCDQAPCDIQLGSDAIMRVTFFAYRDIATFSPRTIAFLGPIPIPYELPPNVRDTACDNLEGAECPIAAGSTVVYVFRFPVGPNYPPTNNLQIELSLMEDDSLINCIRVPINAVN